MQYHGPIYGKINRRYIPLKHTSQEIDAALLDKARLDWLADPANTIGNVTLPKDIVMRNIESLRAAIDEAMQSPITDH